MGAHFSNCSAISLAKSCGEPPVGSKPTRARLARSSGAFSASLISPLILLTTSAGVPAGPQQPY
jgi:hypothetical protein